MIKKAPRLYFAGQAHHSPQWPQLQLASEAAHYLKNVLRLKINDTIELFDQTQQSLLFRVTQVDKKIALLEFEQALVSTISKQQPKIHLALGRIRNERMHWALQKLTELGVHHIIPIQADFSQLAGKISTNKQTHWQNIVIAACCQCRRNDLPIINASTRIDDALTATKDTLQIVFDGNAESRAFNYSMALQKHDAISLFIGPEGGWSARELALFEQQQIASVSLGILTLRAETAAISALSILQNQLQTFETST